MHLYPLTHRIAASTIPDAAPANPSPREPEQRGWLRSRGFGDGACLLFFATRYLPEGVLVSFVKIPHGAMAPLAPPQPQMS